MYSNPVPVTKYDESTSKWYLTDENGDYKIKEGTDNEKIELNKVKWIINPNYTLTLQNSVGGWKTYFFKCN
ncbi:MAG: hypothetical protein IJU54_01100 [Alphaproteobacteria bacterium]|nr:hypothetical protein [Alphaproteobacteria bacterium]